MSTFRTDILSNSAIIYQQQCIKICFCQIPSAIFDYISQCVIYTGLECRHAVKFKQNCWDLANFCCNVGRWQVTKCSGNYRLCCSFSFLVVFRGSLTKSLLINSFIQQIFDFASACFIFFVVVGVVWFSGSAANYRYINGMWSECYRW
jgi:hypothetical protein